MTKQITKTNKLIKTAKKSVRNVKPKYFKGFRVLKQQEFRQIMDRLDLIDKEIKKEEELFDVRMKSLRLEKEYLWNRIKPKKRRNKK